MMVLKLLCYFPHCWHRILLLFHFGRMYKSRNQNCYCKCYCNRKIFHFGWMLQYHCSHWSPRCLVGFLCAVDVPQVCLHCCESRPHWSWYQSLSQRIFLLRRVCWGGKLQYFLQYFQLLYCLFHFGRVYCLGMSNAFGGGVVTPLSLELAQWYCWEGLFRLVAFSRAHH